MREIKFRVWRGISEKMFYFKDKYKMTDADEKCGCFIPSECLGDTIDHCGDDIVMQFTGLKDRNGKEIYEDDILFDRQLKDKRPYIVIWSEPEARFNLYFEEKKNKKDKRDFFPCRGWCDFDESISSGLEIVGNIHENPELLW